MPDFMPGISRRNSARYASASSNLSEFRYNTYALQPAVMDAVYAWQAAEVLCLYHRGVRCPAGVPVISCNFVARLFAAQLELLS